MAVGIRVWESAMSLPDSMQKPAPGFIIAVDGKNFRWRRDSVTAMALPPRGFIHGVIEHVRGSEWRPHMVLRD